MQAWRVQKVSSDYVYFAHASLPFKHEAQREIGNSCIRYHFETYDCA